MWSREGGVMREADLGPRQSRLGRTRCLVQVERQIRDPRQKSAGEAWEARARTAMPQPTTRKASVILNLEDRVFSPGERGLLNPEVGFPFLHVSSVGHRNVPGPDGFEGRAVLV